MRIAHALSIGLLFLASSANAALVGTPLPDAMTAEQAQRSTGLFQEEAQILEASLEGKMKIVVMGTDDPIIRNYVARGLLHTDGDSFSKQENGLAAVLVVGGKINGITQTACYVVFNPARAAHAWRNFLDPLTQKGDQHAGAAFLMGHEVGHCLDQFERNTRLSVKNWSSGEAGTFGIQTDAWIRSGGDAQKINMEEYRKIAKPFFADGAQLQYQERLADAFGVLWAWHRKADLKLAATVRQNRGYAETWSSHATAPALKDIDQFQDQAQAMTLPDIWMLSRGLQVKSGVDARLKMAGDKGVRTTIAKAETKPAAEKPAEIKPTVAAEIPKTEDVKPIKQLDAMGRVRFGEQKRFGQTMNQNR